MPYFLSRYDPDTLRFYLTATLPEIRDTEFSWEDFVEHNNDLYAACKFRATLGEAMALAREANGYLDRKAPWFQIKEDPAPAATTVHVILRNVDNLKTILAPILPHHTAQQLRVPG